MLVKSLTSDFYRFTINLSRGQKRPKVWKVSLGIIKDIFESIQKLLEYCVPLKSCKILINNGLCSGVARGCSFQKIDEGEKPSATIKRMMLFDAFWFQGLLTTHREFLLRNGVGKTCLWKKYILLYECIQKQGKKNF